MYDLLIVGAGLSAATLAAVLKNRLRICVVDTRRHLGGNCYDFRTDGTLVHQYGPHIFHSPSPRIVAFLSQFTRWTPYRHTVTAEIHHAGQLRYVPFPYCRATERLIGEELKNQEIIERFFRHYSRKMWAVEWEELPSTVRGRIPMELMDEPCYYTDQFVALPSLGYTHMIENMFDGVELILGADPTSWTGIPAETIVYTGRPDLVPHPLHLKPIGEVEALRLSFRTLDISFATEIWPYESVCLHCCTEEKPWTRKTSFARMTGGSSSAVSTEVPRDASLEDTTPFYPIESPANTQRMKALSERIRFYYPNLHLLGRLGTYRYLDMYQTVGQAMALADRVWTK